MKFKEDHFANIDLIAEVDSKVLILHSSADEIIPISHAKLLFQKFVRKNGEGDIDFVEVSKIKHNSLHRYIVSQQENALQKEVFTFLLDLMYSESGQTSARSSRRQSVSEPPVVKTPKGEDIERTSKVLRGKK